MQLLRNLRRERRLQALVAVVLCLAPACKAIGARTYNLGQLHDEDGHHRRKAALVSDSEYQFQQFLAALRRDPARAIGGEPKKIEDPLDACVQNLLQLTALSPANESQAALRVEYLARYSVIDPWELSRRICLHQLGKEGGRLKLGQHPAAPETSTSPATPDNLREALAPLVRAMLPRTALEPAGDLAAACRGMAQLRYDFDGGLRALAASSALLARLPEASADSAPLLELVLDLERRLVRMAIERGLKDENPFVRASAVEALVRANGGAYLAKVFPLMVSDPDIEVALTILARARSQGLAPAQPGAKAAQSDREAELALLVSVATEHPDGRVRVRAMQALGEVSGAGFQSLREEDWGAWWHKRNATATP